jgi:hypothetical protein
MIRAILMSGILFVSSLATPLYGQESGGTDEEHRNAVELFLGGVTETDDSSTGLGVGLGYVRHLSSRWGLGVTGELSTSDVSRDWLAIVPVYLFPVGGLALLAGPAIEGSEEKPEDGGEAERTTNVGVRFGAAWEFELGKRFTLSPEVNLDVIDGGTTWVYGLAVGVGF